MRQKFPEPLPATETVLRALSGCCLCLLLDGRTNVWQSFLGIGISGKPSDLDNMSLSLWIMSSASRNSAYSWRSHSRSLFGAMHGVMQTHNRHDWHSYCSTGCALEVYIPCIEEHLHVSHYTTDLHTRLHITMCTTYSMLWGSMSCSWLHPWSHHWATQSCCTQCQSTE